jgi:hypothetical protein
MTKRIKNFSKSDSMRTFRIGSIIGLGVLCGWFTYLGIINAIAEPNMIFLYAGTYFFGTGVTLCCMLVSIFVEEDDVTPKSEYIQ